MRLWSLDDVAYNEKLRKRVPTDILVDKISELNDNFSIQNNGLGLSIGHKLVSFAKRMLIMMSWSYNMKGRRRNQFLLRSILGILILLNLALSITFACHKENLLLNIGSMRWVFEIFHIIIAIILRSIHVLCLAKAVKQ